MRWGHFILITFRAAFCSCKVTIYVTVCGEIRVCNAAMACKVKFNVHFLTFVSWFLFSDDVTDGLGTGKGFWL